VLKYTITHDQLVELMSTEVPQSHRGKGVAAHLAKVRPLYTPSLTQLLLFPATQSSTSFLLQAALDFVVEENMKARISCGRLH